MPPPPSSPPPPPCYPLLKQTAGVYKTVAQWSAGLDETGAYSQLNVLRDNGDQFKGADGKFEFKIKWDDGDMQHWRQTSNPMVHPGCSGHCGVTGYEEVDVSSTALGWGGLEYSGKNAVLDGSVNSPYSGYWFYAVGSKYEWNGGIPGTTFTTAALTVDFQVCTSTN